MGWRIKSIIKRTCRSNGQIVAKWALAVIIFTLIDVLDSYTTIFQLHKPRIKIMRALFISFTSKTDGSLIQISSNKHFSRHFSRNLCQWELAERCHGAVNVLSYISYHMNACLPFDNMFDDTRSCDRTRRLHSIERNVLHLEFRRGPSDIPRDVDSRG